MKNENVRMKSPKFDGQCPRMSTPFLFQSKVCNPDWKFKILAEIIRSLAEYIWLFAEEVEDRIFLALWVFLIVCLKFNDRIV